MRTKRDIQRLLKKGKHFCLAPWVHLHVTGLGIMGLCAMSEQGPFDTGYGSLNTNSFPELWQGEAIREFRLKMLEDQPDSRCVNCYKSRLGYTTLRNEINSYYWGHLDWVAHTDASGYAPRAKPIFWDIRFSNICNLKCRSCIDVSSTGWYEDAKAMGFLNARHNGEPIQGVKDPARLLQDLEPYLPHLEGIRFAGGEPLLMEENYYLMQKLDAQRKYNIRIEYETNMTKLYYKKDLLLSLWKKFKNILVSVSLDGLEERCEYLRKGLKWEKVLGYINDIKAHCPGIGLRINYTVSAYNILHVAEFHRTMVEKKYIGPEQIQLIFLVEPNYLSMKILPPAMKKAATNKLMNHIRWLHREYPFRSTCGFRNCGGLFIQWLTCIKKLNEEDWSHLIPQFIDYTNKLDTLRRENCLSVFPEVNGLFRLRVG